MGALSATKPAPAADCPSADDKVDAVADPYQVTPGGNTTYSAYGFAPNGKVEIFLCSTPISLGVVTADADGNIVQKVTIPAGTSLGAHTLAATGTAPSGRSRVAYAAINVVSSSAPPATTTTAALPRTGSDSGRMVAVGGALILLGGAALAGSLKSRRSATA